MKSNYLILLLIITINSPLLLAQTLTGEQLLENAIKYHDPNNQWTTFNDTLNVTMELPKRSSRDSQIVINLPHETFYLKAVRDTITTEYTVIKDTCNITYNGNSKITAAFAKTHNLSCERAKMFKNYYTYLYGLPMKLKDPGTIIDKTVQQKTFKGKDYLVLKASYDKAVGSDVWFFYFNPETFAMEVYQFFKTDDQGKLKLDTGEYILLTEQLEVNQIKIPKIRAWYYNKDDKYLGTDILKK